MDKWMTDGQTVDRCWAIDYRVVHTSHALWWTLLRSVFGRTSFDQPTRSGMRHKWMVASDSMDISSGAQIGLNQSTSLFDFSKEETNTNANNSSSSSWGLSGRRVKKKKKSKRKKASRCAHLSSWATNCYCRTSNSGDVFRRREKKGRPRAERPNRPRNSVGIRPAQALSSSSSTLLRGSLFFLTTHTCCAVCMAWLPLTFPFLSLSFSAALSINQLIYRDSIPRLPYILFDLFFIGFIYSLSFWQFEFPISERLAPLYISHWFLHSSSSFNFSQQVTGNPFSFFLFWFALQRLLFSAPRPISQNNSNAVHIALRYSDKEYTEMGVGGG
jgi:hypothetical protein